MTIPLPGDDRDPAEPIDLVVVGAGLAGLAAATAALDGHRCVLIDAHQPGGRAQSVTRDGFTFNLGAHALVRGGPAMATLRALGVTPAGRVPDTSSGRGCRGEVTGALPAGPASLLRTPLLSARGKWAATWIMRRLPRLDPSTVADRSAADLIDEWSTDATARDLMAMMVRLTTYSADATQLSGDAAVRQLQLAVDAGVLYLHGGWQRLVDQLRDRFTSLGGRVVTDTAIHSVASHHARVTLTTGTDTITARTAIVACGTPEAAAALLGRDLAIAGRLGPAVTASCLTLGLATPPSTSLLLGLDRPLYLSVHSPVAELSPPGTAVVEVLEYLTGDGSDGDDDHRTAAAQRHRLEDFAARAGITGADIVTSRFLRRMTVAGGTPIAAAGGLAGRPPVEVPGVEGVYLAGDWVGPEGLLADASLASGRAAAQAAGRALAAPAKLRVGST